MVSRRGKWLTKPRKLTTHKKMLDTLILVAETQAAQRTALFTEKSAD